MSELYHYGVKGMKWGVRRSRDTRSNDPNYAYKTGQTPTSYEYRDNMHVYNYAPQGLEKTGSVRAKRVAERVRSGLKTLFSNLKNRPREKNILSRGNAFVRASKSPEARARYKNTKAAGWKQYRPLSGPGRDVHKKGRLTVTYHDPVIKL